jgi:hypothetical protein
METGFIIAEQIARLFHRYPGVVWEVIELPGPPRPRDVPIRDEYGNLVAYARPLG